MKNTKYLLATTLILTLMGCSSTPEKEKLYDEIKTYTKTKTVFCDSGKVMSYYESDDLISVSCSDGSAKTLFLKEE